jgi:hypothetical protein
MVQMSDGIERALIDMQARDIARYKSAGDALAIAAMRVVTDYDGLHRLRLAVAEWNNACANEGNRDIRHGKGCANETSSFRRS